MTRLARIVRWLAPAATAVLLTGCATIWSRGLVQDARGEGIPGIEVLVVEQRDGKGVTGTVTNYNGCFQVGPLSASGRRNFELEIRAPGFKPVTLKFDLQTPILYVSLLPASSEAESAIHPATYSERSERWEPNCIPVLPPGAQELGP